MASAFSVANKITKDKTDKAMKDIYSAMAIELHKDGWGIKRLKKLCEELKGVFDDLENEDKSAIQILDEETGVEMMAEDCTKHYYELSFLDGKIWEENKKKLKPKAYNAYATIAQQRMKDWVRLQVYATIFIGLHRLYGYSHKRINDLYVRMYELEQEHDFDTKKIDDALRKALSLTLVKIKDHTIEFMKVGENGCLEKVN